MIFPPQGYKNISYKWLGQGMIFRPHGSYSEEEESQEEDNDEETEEGNGWLNRGDGWCRGPTDDNIYGSDVPA